MLDALRRRGKSLPPADLSAASLAAGAQSVTLTPTEIDAGFSQPFTNIAKFSSTCLGFLA